MLFLLYNFFTQGSFLSIYSHPEASVLLFLIKIFFFIFIIAFIGVLLSTNLLKFLLCLELMLLTVSVLFILFAISTSTILGFIYVFVILTLAAAESAIGLGLLVVSFRLNGTVNFTSYQRLKG